MFATIEKREHTVPRMPAGGESRIPTTVPATDVNTLFRRSSCACGGGCPSCQAGAGNLKVSQANDAAEIEADAIADRVMRMPARKEPTAHSRAKVSDDTIHRQPTTPAAEEEPDPIGEGLSTLAENLGENNPEFSQLTEQLADSFLSQPAPISVGIPAFLGANYAFIWGLALANPQMRRHMNDFNFGTLPGIVPQFPLKTFTYRILNEEQSQFEFDLGLDASGLIEMLNEGAFNTHISTLSAETTGRLDTETPSVGLSSLNVNLGLFDDGLMLSGGFRQGVDPYPLFERDRFTGEGSRIMQQIPSLPDLYPGEQDIRFMLQLDFVRLYNYLNPSSSPIKSMPQQFEGDRVDRKSASGGEPSASARNPDHVKSAITSGGQPLDAPTRNFFEPRLGYDLSAVRIHTGAAASESANAVDARAYTLGNNIVFGNGEYAPHSESGRHLIAHELAHTMQQSRGMSSVVDGGTSTEPYIARKPTSGRCGGWDCSSDCKKTDAGDTPSTDKSTRRSMTIYIDIDVAKATDISGADDVGHTYVKFSESNGNRYTYGFYHNKSKAPDVFLNPEVPGCVAHPDKTHWQCVDMEVNFDLTATEYGDALDRAQAWCGAPPRYHITDRNCTTFVSDVASAAGKTLPPHRSKAGLGTFSREADNPNALFDSYVSQSEGERWRDLVDNDFTGYYTRKGESGATAFTDFELDINKTFGVTGEYEFKRSDGEEVKGTITGHVEFKVDGATNAVRPILYFKWRDKGGASGLGKLRVMDSGGGGGGMVGTWGWNREDDDGGDWILNKN